MAPPCCARRGTAKNTPAGWNPQPFGHGRIARAVAISRRSTTRAISNLSGLKALTHGSSHRAQGLPVRHLASSPVLARPSCFMIWASANGHHLRARPTILQAALVTSVTTIEAAHAATTVAGVQPQVVTMATLDAFQVLLCHCNQGFSPGSRKYNTIPDDGGFGHPQDILFEMPSSAPPQRHRDDLRTQPLQPHLLSRGPGERHGFKRPELYVLWCVARMCAPCWSVVQTHSCSDSWTCSTQERPGAFDPA